MTMSARTDFTHVDHHTDLLAGCTAGHRPQATGYWLLAMCHKLQALGYKPQATDSGPQATGHMLPAIG